MPKARKPKNRGLPKRWTQQHGAYYYRVPEGVEHLWDGKKMFRLGKTLPEAYREWSERMVQDITKRTIQGCMDRYMLEVAPKKAPKTYRENASQAKKVCSVFGHMNLADIEPQHIYQYFDKREAKVSAKREIALLSHLLTKCVEWGYIGKHPFKGEVRLAGEKPRTRYIEDWEIIECLNLPARRKKGSVRAIQTYIRLKLLTGLRRGDLLRIKISDCKEDGIHVTTKKTGKPVIYEWTPELRQAVESAKLARPVDISPFLFCTKRGKCYVDTQAITSGWDSMWQRFMKRVLKETEIIERFTEHDLRAKCASDAETLEHARQLLTHADSKITQRVYRRKPETIRPLR